MRKYGVNVVSLLPWSLGSRGPERSIEIAIKAGFDGIQALPMHGWNYENIVGWSKDVISYEDAWAYGTFWQALLRQLGFLDFPAPLFQDLIFGKREMPEISSAIKCFHDGYDVRGNNLALEVKASRGVLADYVSYCKNGGHVVWDTKHIRGYRDIGFEENPVNRESSIVDWRELLYSSSIGAIKLIHVNPIKDLHETEMLLAIRPSYCPLTNMLMGLSVVCDNDVPVILEVRPRFLTLSKTIKYLSELREGVKRWLN